MILTGGAKCRKDISTSTTGGVATEAEGARSQSSVAFAATRGTSTDRLRGLA